MKSKRSIVTVVAALALSTSIAGPVLAGPPTFSGPVTCVRASDGTVDDIGVLESVTKKEIAAFKKFWTNTTGFCKKGSVDVKSLTRDA